MGAQRVAQAKTRLRPPMPPYKRSARDLVEAADPVGIDRFGEADAQPERGIADRAADEERVAGAGAGARHHAAGRDLAEGGDRDRQRSGGADRVAAEQRAGEGAEVVGEAGAEGVEPRLRPVVR